MKCRMVCYNLKKKKKSHSCLLLKEFLLSSELNKNPLHWVIVNSVMISTVQKTAFASQAHSASLETGAYQVTKAAFN